MTNFTIKHNLARTALLLLTMLCCLSGARAQETVEIGVGGTTNNSYLPSYSLYNYSLTQQIYTADEIGMAGTINSIAFKNTGAEKTRTYNVYMLLTDKETFTGGTDWVAMSDGDLVFAGELTFTVGEWTTIDLDTPFAYDGISNLLVGVADNTGSDSFSPHMACLVFEATSQALRAFRDASAYNIATPGVSGSVLNVKNQIILDITPSGGSICAKPETLEASNETATGVTLTWTGGSGTYNVEYKKASDTEWTPAAEGTTELTIDLTGLTPGTSYQARVQSVCSGDATSGWKSVNFTTDCGAITDFPWTETFESYAAGNFVGLCWVNEHIEGEGTYLFRVSTSSMGGNSTHQLQLPDMAIGTLTKLVLPEMNLPANYEFSIDIYRSTSTYNDHYADEGIRVYASTDGEIEGATELAFIPRHFEVSNDVIPAESAAGWYTYELPIGMSGTCYIILRGESQYCTATYMDNLTVKEAPSCPKPTGFAVVSNSVTAHEATVTWTENGEATNWELAYSYMEGEETMEQHIPITQNPYTITGLIPEMHYFNVCVRAKCGEDDNSEWSNMTDFTTTIACPAPTGLAANPGNFSAVLNWNGTSDSYIVSYRTAAYAEGIVEEFNTNSVPAGWTRYSGLVDDVIAGEATLTTTSSGWQTTSNTLGQYNMKVNIYGTYSKYWLVTPEFNLSQNLSFDLALTKYNSADPIQDETLQADDRFVVLIYADDAWHILREWNNSGSEYVYNNISYEGENVTINLSAYYGKRVKIAFYGESTNPQGMENTGGDNDLHIDNVICGIPYEAGEWKTITVDETTATIPDLTPLTAYEAKVQGDCGELDGVSLETPVISFTTLEECPVPQNLEVEDITHNSATVSWEGYTDSYSVSYRTAAYAEGIVEEFNTNSVPAGWTRYSGLVDDVIAGEATLTSVNSYWNTTNIALGQYNMKLNIYSSSCKYWLVTPEFELGQDQDLSFDLALTDYGNANPIEDPTAQADDRFIVLIYADDAWHILREWNNSGSEYVFNEIPATGENVTIDLSDYSGQNVKIAFYGESTNPSEMENTAGDNDLHIDNVICGIPYDAGDWQPAISTSNSVTLTDLTPETLYEVKVMSDCSDLEEWSEVATFTTMGIAEITFAKEGYGTYFNSAKDVVLPAGMKAYVVTAHESEEDATTGTPTYAEIADGDGNNNIVPARTAVLLQYEASDEVQTILVGLDTPSAAAITETNFLHGSDIATTTTGDGKHYKLSYNESGKELGWYWGEDGGAPFTSGAHKAWLVLPTPITVDDARFFGLPGFDVDNTTTAVNSIEDGKLKIEDDWYSVDGRKLDKQPTRKGVYLNNGRKVVIK